MYIIWILDITTCIFYDILDFISSDKIICVPEPTTNVKLDRINADLRVVKEIGAHIDINIKDDDIVRVIRLGKKVDNNNSVSLCTCSRGGPLTLKMNFPDELSSFFFASSIIAFVSSLSFGVMS
jgi:hypothetical protein